MKNSNSLSSMWVTKENLNLEKSMELNKRISQKEYYKTLSSLEKLYWRSKYTTTFNETKK